MASKNFCDRCGNEVKNFTVFKNQLKLPRIIEVVDTRATEKGAGYKTIDVCPSCMTALRVWFGLETVERESER